MTGPQLHAVLSGLQATLDAIDAGRIDATPTERAYLAGALDVARRMAGPPPEPDAVT